MNQRRQFVETVSDVLDRDPEVVLLLCDISVFAFRHAKEEWPDRVLNVGISEQGAVGMAAGLAKSGFYPIVHTIDVFLARRAYEFIRLDFGDQKLPGLFVSVGHDQDYKELGPSHHCPEGGDLMRHVPGMLVHEPENEEMVALFIAQAVKHRQLAYVRTRA